MSHHRTKLYESQNTLKLDIKYTCLEIFSWESQIEFKINFASKWHYNAEGMSHSFEHNKLISISLTNLHWIFSVILVIIEILFFWKNLQCFACFPKLWSYQIMNIIIMLSFKIFGLVCISRRLAITKLHLNHGKRWRTTMEHPSHPQQNSLNSTPPPLPDLVWRNTAKIWWQKKKIENWGWGVGKVFKRSQSGVSMK